MTEPEITEAPKRLGERTAEELVAPFKERAERARERTQHKVTPEDVLRRSEERAKARAATAPQRRSSRATQLRTGLGIALLVATGVTLIVHTGITSNAGQQRSADEAEILELRESVGYLEGIAGVEAGGQVDTEAQVEIAADGIEHVRTLATEVAELQTEFYRLQAANSGGSGNGAPSQGFMDAVDHRRTLEPYFASGTLLLDDEMAYSLSSILPLRSDQIDPRLQWYDRVLSAGGYTWTVVSVAGSEAGDVSKFDVVWLAQDDATGDLLAWASASWSRDVEAFVSLTVGTTTLGDKQNALTARMGE